MFIGMCIIIWYNLHRNALTVLCLPPKGGDENEKERFFNLCFNRYHHSAYSSII